MGRRALLALPVLLWSLAAVAGGPSVDGLMMGLDEGVALGTGAKGREPSYSGGLAAGFVAGIAALQEGKQFCPDTPRPLALLAAVRSYLLQHPQAYAEPAATVVSRALAQAFPCPPGTGAQ